jgi:geranylgeranyl diphosphate synthase type II
MSLENFINYQKMFNENIGNILHKYIENKSMEEMILYSLKGGKRLRPIMAMAISLKTGGSLSKILKFALAIELIHTSSLIIDDLPCMDNDFYRRGRESLHHKYSVTKAQVLSSAMINIAIRLIFENFDDNIIIVILNNLSKNLGIMGAAGGQLIDITPKTIDKNKKELMKDFRDKDQLKSLFQKKTTSFFEIAFIGGYLSNKKELEHIPELIECSKYFGLAFQIYDDFDDIEQDKQRTNINIVDPNFINNFGKKEAFEEFEYAIKKFNEKIFSLNLNCPIIEELVNFLVSKVKTKYLNIKED